MPTFFYPSIRRLAIPQLENWTRVRIWRPTWEALSGPTDLIGQGKENTRNPKAFSFAAVLAGGHVGHVSVQTTKFYSSVYPDSADKNAIQLGKPTDLGFVTKPEYDEKALKEPNLVVDFFSLNTEIMTTLFNQVKSGKIPYRAFQFYSTNGMNCSDLSFKLLEEGGLKELLTFADKLKLLPATISFLTPNVLGNILLKAKQQEMKKFPETRELRIDPESNSPTHKAP